jgi:putative glutathione S-transferase
MRDIYLAGDPAFSGRASVPLLWDAERGGIVSHSSREIVLLLNSHPQADGPDLYPGAHRARIDADVASFDKEFVAAIIRAGSTASQAEYEQAVRGVFGWLDRLDERLAGRRYLGGRAVDLADLVVFTGLVRFDTCYHFGSRCHLRRIQDYPNLWGYVRDIYQLPGVADTVDLDASRRSFFSNSPAGRDGIIPVVPEIDFSAPHGRERLEGTGS